MNDVKTARRLRYLLTLLIFVLVFEGLGRKALPPAYGVPLYLFKDAIVLVLGFFVALLPLNPATSFLWNSYKILAVLFVPLIFETACHDPLLAVFGAKQYLLFPIVALAMFHAFEFSHMEDILKFYRWISLLVIPTAALAAVQLKLPHDHWLNRSVAGESLEDFQAAGQLRVSSTFSFLAQYCIFLNAEVSILMLALHDWRKHRWYWQIAFASLLPLLVFSSFATGSRGAVTGNLVIIVVGAILALIKVQVRSIAQIALVVAGLYGAVGAIHYFFPDAMAAYSYRENGQLIGVSAEIRERVWGTFYWIGQDRNLMTFLGNGLGVMSNGAGTFSLYAVGWRNSMWTEADFPTTLFEGGFYMAVIWYGFRLYIIGVTTYRFVRGLSGNFVAPVAFVQAFIIVIGLFGTLGTQPPIAIWWWMGVGTSLIFWWKCVGPPPPEEPLDGSFGKARRLPRGRSLYAEVLHAPREKAAVAQRAKPPA